MFSSAICQLRLKYGVLSFTKCPTRRILIALYLTMGRHIFMKMYMTYLYEYVRPKMNENEIFLREGFIFRGVDGQTSLEDVVES